jgi:hypothetical protein
MHAIPIPPLSSFVCRLAIVLVLWQVLAAPVLAQQRGGFTVIGADVEKKANAILGLMQFTLTPDVTTSTLSISNSPTGNPSYSVTQLGGGDTVGGARWPLYLEGNAAVSRYDPVFIASNGTEQRQVPAKWNSATATGGIGWDFLVAEDLKLRPVAVISLGRVSSDLKVAQSYLEWKSGREIDFLQAGSMDAYGLGGSLMLDYERYRPDSEIDVELRYNAIRLNSLNANDDAVHANYLARSANLWARYRAPTGFYALDRPLRYVLETTLSNYYGSQGDLLGFNRLLSLGVGLELDSTKYAMIVTRTRLVLRYVVGNNVEGVSVGFAISF